MPAASDPDQWMKELEKQNLLYKAGDYIPKTGDVVFFEDSTVGITTRQLTDKEGNVTGITVIMGDLDDGVKEQNIHLNAVEEAKAEQPVPLAYGRLLENPSKDALESISAGELATVEEETDSPSIQKPSTSVTTPSKKPSAPQKGVFGLKPLALVIDGTEPMVLASGAIGTGNVTPTGIRWRLPDSDTWTDYTGGSSIPANAVIKINADYGNVDPHVLAAHGAVHIMKYDSNDASVRLEGAEFVLYRAKYVEADPDMIEFVAGTPDSIRNKRYLAVCQGPDITPECNHPEVRVRRNLEGHITHVEVIHSDDTKEWMTLNEAYLKHYSFHHKLDRDADKNIQLFTDEVLARGVTDENGNLSYGFGGDDDFGTRYDEDGNEITGTLDSENRIHFNKIYAVVETKAPAGYELDSTPPLFRGAQHQLRLQWSW